MPSFQSYLVVGARVSAREKTEEILRASKAKITKASPDIFIISPEKSSIGIENIRDLKKHIFQKPVTLPYKYVIFEQADTLTTEAQNALLKILEEPPASAVIILEAINKSQLLPTVLSRVTLIWANKEKNGEDEPPQDAKTWVEQQILKNYSLLKSAASSGESTEKYVRKIEQLKDAKLMLNANVNPKFVLANLIYTL